MATQLAMTKSFEKFRTELSIKFPAKKVDEILQYYEALRRDAWLDRYDSCLVNSGKFVEAVLKCFHFLRTDIEVDSINNANNEIQQLESDINLNIFERMTIPRVIKAI